MSFINDFAGVPAIMVLCYVAAEVFKTVLHEKNYKHIPVFCALVGLVLGVVCFVIYPGYIPAENHLVAAAIGAISGLATTGVNQLAKQEIKK